MYCNKCGSLNSKVIDSRQSDDGKTIKRRRECVDCGARFTTFEKIEDTPLLVTKRDGTTQEFNRDKVLKGIIRACEKRPVSIYTMNKIVDLTERELRNSLDAQVSTSMIGDIVMRELKKVDEVSYVRFASVYRSFKDSQSFLEEIKAMMEDKNNDSDKN
ncbi:MAG: transcriptional regulator NrdR [Firmicutes bacterium]|nr:transcriptional regulator NrdR [Bacillota bacterium]